MKEMKIIRGLILSAITAISMIAGDVQDMQGLKTGATPACCSKLVTGQVWQDGMAVPTSSTGSMSQTGTLTWSGGTTTQGTSGGSFSGASDYFSDATTTLGVGQYAQSSGSGTWVVPVGISKMQVVIVGGGGIGGKGGTPTRSLYGGGSGGGAGSGKIVAKTLYVQEGQSITWSVGGPGQQSCFNGWCAAGGSNGSDGSGSNGGAGGSGGSGGGGGGLGGKGTSGRYDSAVIGGIGKGGFGFGYGTVGTNGINGTACTYAYGVPSCGGGGTGGVMGGNGGSGYISGSGTGQGIYSTTINSSVSAKRLSDNAYTTFNMPSNGFGYGGDGGQGSASTVIAPQNGQTGGNGMIFVWTE